MAVMRLARLALRTAAWRTPRSAIASGAPPATSRLQGQGPLSRVTYRRFATTQSRSAAAQKEMDESLLNMDIDAAENHMKDWFGDHASWSHDQLLKLVYGTAPSHTTSHPHADYRKRRTSYPHDICKCLATTLRAVCALAVAVCPSHS
jgi:hypothetical protein